MHDVLIYRIGRRHILELDIVLVALANHLWLPFVVSLQMECVRVDSAMQVILLDPILLVCLRLRPVIEKDSRRRLVLEYQTGSVSLDDTFCPLVQSLSDTFLLSDSFLHLFRQYLSRRWVLRGRRSVFVGTSAYLW